MDRYEEALEKARTEYEKARKQGYTWLMVLLEGMFHELKESEDERIRKEIIHYILYKADGVSEKQEHEWVAWLEKQKEQPTNEEMLRTLRVEYEKGVADTIAKYEQKEQKFTEKQDFSDLTDLERAIHRGFLVVGVENVPVTIIKETAQDCLAQMKQQKGANGNEKEIPFDAWGEEDDEHLGRILKELENQRQRPFNRPYLDKIESDYNWLKFLKDRVQPQPKQEWSEEDRLHYANVLEALEYLKGCKSDYDKIEAIKSDIAWLKSLKNRYTWKPNEEQMDMLAKVCSTLHLTSSENEIMESLYEQLEKLREE